ncbi:hypothetical protein [Pseudonocardia adelaidensis]|uniref:hypothetical protein n=1 Tax=Pseudonocardia adelaidensis TaxID=648754 RepID=UPI0031F069F3
MGRAVGMTWQRARTHSDDRTARRLQAAERKAEGAAARYRALKEAAAAPTSGDGTWRPMPSWQQMLLLVVGGGILMGLLIIWLLATAYLGPASLLALPAAAGLVAGFIALRRRRPRPATPRRRPLVADLVRAAQEMHEAEAALQRLRQECS